MPSKSKAQHDAMAAAAHGHSTLGIPSDVAREYLEADKAAGKYAGKKRRKKKAHQRRRAKFRDRSDK